MSCENYFGRSLLYRQRNDDVGAVLQAGFNTDVAVMRFYDPANDGQTETSALGFCSAKHRGKSALLQFFAQAFARVFKFD